VTKIRGSGRGGRHRPRDEKGGLNTIRKKMGRFGSSRENTRRRRGRGGGGRGRGTRKKKKRGR